MSFIVAIDGPSGTGKGTITKLIANELGLLNIDTGAMYRCIALTCLRNNITTIEKKEEIIKIAKNIKIEMKDDKGTLQIYLDGENVSDQIRSKEVSGFVAPISSIIEVREIMVDLQRKMAENKDVIMEGRDITTVVFPNANVKIYLDATAEERANRRFKQNKLNNILCTYEEVLENIEKRDYNDLHKKVGALKRSDDQVYIDTTNKTIEEVVDIILNVVRGEK